MFPHGERERELPCGKTTRNFRALKNDLCKEKFCSCLLVARSIYSELSIKSAVTMERNPSTYLVISTFCGINDFDSIFGSEILIRAHVSLENESAMRKNNTEFQRIKKRFMKERSFALLVSCNIYSEVSIKRILKYVTHKYLLNIVQCIELFEYD